MKKLNLTQVAALCFFSLVTFISLLSKKNSDIFTDDQRKKIIESIENECGDSWCEGDHEYEFIKIACNKLNRSCLLQYYLVPDESTRLLNYEKKFCRLYNINNFSQVINQDKRLTRLFYEQLDECISNI